MRREEEIGLIRKAKEGDTVAFAAMIRRYQNLVYATAFQILKDTALAEDVAQEAFVTAFQSLRGLRTESSFPPWRTSGGPHAVSSLSPTEKFCLAPLTIGWYITEFMIECQTTSGEDGYNFTGQGRSAGVRLRQHLPARRRHVLRRTDLDAAKLAWIPKT